MTPETAPPSLGSSGGNDNVTSTKNQDSPRESTTINDCQGWGRWSCGGRVGYQGHGKQGVCFNWIPDSSCMHNFKG